MFLETADIETASTDYASRFSGAAGEYFLDKQTEIALSLVADLPQARVLDVGGGHAQLAVPLVKAGFEVTVTGSDESCRNRLDQLLGSEDFGFRICDSLSLPFADRSFEVVMAFRLLPHVTRWQQLLAELCRVADRCVILDYPDRRSTNILYEHCFGIKKKIEGNTRPFTLFSRKGIRDQLVHNEFRAPVFKPEFLLPMVIHRKINNRVVSALVENCCKIVGATHLWGSPIIFRSDRKV